MPIDKPSQTALDLLYSVQNGLLEDPVGRAMRRVIQLGVAGNTEIGWLHERVTKHKTAQMYAGPFQQTGKTHGEIVHGTDDKGLPIRQTVQAMSAHTLTLGGSGSGKTTKSRWMILQAAKHVKGLFLFDFRKREYRCLVPWFAAMGTTLKVVPARALRLNPLEVPHHVAPYSWATRVADVLVQVFRLPARATKLINVTLLELFDRFGVSQGGRRFPTLFDLREAVAGKATANAPARMAVIDAMDPVLMSLRSVLCYRRGWSTSDLAKHHIVFELDGVGEVEKDLILSSLILPEFTSRVAAGVSNKRMNLLVCCDEAARLVSATGTGLADQIGLIRGTGIGLELSIQFADIAPAILSNSANKFIARCGSASDYSTMAEAMGLTSEQRRYMAQHLVSGRFVGQLAEGPGRSPFWMRVPYLDFSKPSSPKTAQGHPALAGLLPAVGGSMDAADATAGLAELLALPTEVAGEFVDWSPNGQRTSQAGPVTSSAAPLLSDGESRFLQAVIDHPGKPSSAYAKLAGVGTHQAIALRKQLIENGYLREHRVNISSQGRGSIVLEPLPKAQAAVQGKEN